MNNNALYREMALKDFYYQTPKKLIILIKKKIINHSDLAVYSCFLDIFKANWAETYPSQNFIAERTGLERKCVSKILNKLKKLELISFSKINGLKSCTYNLLNPDNAIQKLLSKSNVKDLPSNLLDKAEVESLYGDNSFAIKRTIQIYPNSDPKNDNAADREKTTFLNTGEITKEEDIGIQEERVSTGNIVLLKEPPIPQPPLLDAHALDASALDANHHGFELKLVKKSKNTGPTQMILKNYECDDEGIIRLEFATNANGARFNQNLKIDTYLSKNKLRVSEGECVRFTKEDQLGPRVEKEKKGLSSRSKKKDSRFETVYQRFYEACKNNAYSVPEKNFSNRQIDKLIEMYGVDRFGEILEFQVNHWKDLNKFVGPFTRKGTPSLFEVVLPHICGHVNAHLESKGEKLSGSENKKFVNKAPRVAKSDVFKEADKKSREMLLKRLAEKEKKVI